MTKKRNRSAERQRSTLRADFLNRVEREERAERMDDARKAARQSGLATFTISENGDWTVYRANEEVPFDGGTAKTRAEALASVKQKVGDGAVEMPASSFDHLWIDQQKKT